MRTEVKVGLIVAVVEAALALLVGYILFLAQANSIETKTVETLAGYFDSVDKDMSYDQVLKTIYEDSQRIKQENQSLSQEKQSLIDESARLNVEIDTLQAQLAVATDTTNNSIVESVKTFADSHNYEKALSLLNSIANKTPEMEVLISDYSHQYEAQICEQADLLKAEKKLDDAIALVNGALSVYPTGQALKSKQLEIENSYPKNMIDVVPAYQYGGNPYNEYSSLKSGGTESFRMGGIKYMNGMTFNADINIFDDVSWAIYNLNGEYDSLDFIVCHVDGTFNGDSTALQVFYDGVLKDEIPLSPDMTPKSISLNIKEVVQLKMQVHSSGGDGPVYGVGNPVLN